MYGKCMPNGVNWGSASLRDKSASGASHLCAFLPIVSFHTMKHCHVFVSTNSASNTSHNFDASMSVVNPISVMEGNTKCTTVAQAFTQVTSNAATVLLTCPDVLVGHRHVVIAAIHDFFYHSCYSALFLRLLAALSSHHITAASTQV